MSTAGTVRQLNGPLHVANTVVSGQLPPGTDRSGQSMDATIQLVLPSKFPRKFHVCIVYSGPFPPMLIKQENHPLIHYGEKLNQNKNYLEIMTISI